MQEICFVRQDISRYPDKTEMFNTDNEVFKMVREGFLMLGLDKDNYGTEKWNPLKDYVKHGDHVLIKPNLVLHFNSSGGGIECLYTHPSVVVAVLEYVVVALNGSGKIIVGDAPLQECVFSELVGNSGYDKVIEHYQDMGIDISLVDFRNVKTVKKDGIHYLQEEKGNSGILVRMDAKSAFDGISKERAKNLRITNYDPRILREHHTDKQHEYLVAGDVLDADVVINMPKPKTHRKAGVTISLKNLVGINANKEYLPHHTNGAINEGGDAYLESDGFLSMANVVLDIKNMLVNEGEYELAKMADDLYGKLHAKKKSERYWEGSWYGNDTIWRTIADLNHIILYADKKGVLREERQRKMFIIGDMIISGDKEGPLDPSPVIAGTIVMGDDPVAFDKAVCSVMGFDYHDIPSIEMPGADEKKLLFTSGCEPHIISNYDMWNDKTLIDIRNNCALGFVPSRGWMEKLDRSYLDRLIETVRDNGNRVYVFGAGDNGRFIANELIRGGAIVEAICDNSRALQGTYPIEGVECISPDKMDIGIPVVVTVRMKVVEEVRRQLESAGYNIISFV